MDLKPIIGVTTAFTGKYTASKFIIRFLELLNLKVIKSTTTKPSIIEAGTTLASAEFCLPLRVYVGHIYNLLKEHSEIEYILAPIIKGEHYSSSTCAKYRDLDGVIIRSLSTITGYRLKQNNLKGYDSLSNLIGKETTERLVEKADSFPKILAPEIESLEKNHLRKAAIQVYSEIFKMPKAKKFQFLMAKNLSNSKNEEFRKIETAIITAYDEIVENNIDHYQKLISDPAKIRLALVGRYYMVEDPALSADIKKYFNKKGVAVITVQDIPFRNLKDKYEKTTGFYDSHKISQAFIDTVFDDVDGFIVIGSFGCHPDAFQVDYFAKHITEKGKACWTFKFDEQTGGAGFQTRFETIFGFLKQKRDERLKLMAQDKADNDHISSAISYNSSNAETGKPLFIWPYMGTGLDLTVKETWHQLGLGKFLYPPSAVNEETISLGNTHYTETCSPFALYYGSLRQTFNRLIKDFEENKNSYKKVEPRRIIILMAGGKGPCTFGWYAIAGYEILIEEYSEKLKQYGHSLEMIAIDNQGRNLISFLQELSASADNDRLKQLIKGIKSIQAKDFNVIKKTKTEIEMIKLLKKIVWPAWYKLLAFEEIHGQALIVRAHEQTRGTTTRTLKKWAAKLEEAHTLDEIAEVKEMAIADLANIDQDKIIKPKVVILGEIYVTLTPFANRGTVDNLLGYLGIEAVEGMRLSHFIRGAFKAVKHSYVQNQAMLKPIFQFLEAKTTYSADGWVREPLARPFLEHEIGGDGQPTVAHARYHIENDGVDGILHLYPFKCMPEGIAKDALIEMSQIYGIKSLHLSFDKETEIERLKTELGTFSDLLYQDLERKRDNTWKAAEIERRKSIGKTIENSYLQSMK